MPLLGHFLLQSLSSLSNVKAAVASKQWSKTGKQVPEELLSSENVRCPKLGHFAEYGSHRLTEMLRSVRLCRSARMQARRFQGAACFGHWQFWPRLLGQACCNWSSMCDQSIVKEAHTEEPAGEAPKSCLVLHRAAYCCWLSIVTHLMRLNYSLASLRLA